MKPSTERVLRVLRAAGKRGLTTHDLCQPEVGGIRFGGRLHELRQEGFDIEKKRIGRGRDDSHTYVYVLRREPIGVGAGVEPAGTPSADPDGASPSPSDGRDTSDSAGASVSPGSGAGLFDPADFPEKPRGPYEPHEEAA